MHHFGTAKRILRYIAGTTDYGIWYTHISNPKLVGYTDSDWAGSLEDRKSTSGHIFSIGSGAISWTSKKQPTTALSSTEAEYVAATSAACQAIWLRRLLQDLSLNQEGATEILCDNMSTISMAKNPVFHGRTKHIEIKHHFIREMVNEGSIELKFCPTNNQVADILTKGLSPAKHVYLRKLMGVSNFASRGGVEE